MSPQASLRECAGWYGKIPTLGDFVTRHLPLSFVEPWDEWLSVELSEAQQMLGDTWDETWRGAPIACFSLGARVVDERSWHGVLVPSTDRVGRQFPLTITLSFPSCAGLHLASSAAPAPSAQAWWAALVATGRRALVPGCDANAIDEALSEFVSRQGAVMLTSTGSGGAQCEAATSDTGTSTWSSWRDDDFAPGTPVSFVGLPRGTTFRQLLRTTR